MAKNPLPRLPRRLQARFPDQTPPTYRACYQAAVDGAIPAEFRANRWWVDEADEDEIAEHFGLKAGTAPARRSSEPAAQADAPSLAA